MGGARSYDWDVAMERCARKSDCGGLTCNVNGLGFSKCELRRATSTVLSFANDCKACTSYLKYNKAAESVLVQIESPVSKTLVVNVLAVFGFAATAYGAVRFYTGK